MKQDENVVFLTPYITDITEPRWASLSLLWYSCGDKRGGAEQSQVWDNWKWRVGPVASELLLRAGDPWGRTTLIEEILPGRKGV